MDDGDRLISERMIRNCEALNLKLPRNPLQEGIDARETLHPGWSNDLRFRRRFLVLRGPCDANLRSSISVPKRKKINSIYADGHTPRLARCPTRSRANEQ